MEYDGNWISPALQFTGTRGHSAILHHMQGLPRLPKSCPGHPLPQHGSASLAWCNASKKPRQLQQTTFRGGKGGSILMPPMRLQCCKDYSWYGGDSNHLPLPQVSVQIITSSEHTNSRERAGIFLIKQRLNCWWAWLLLRLLNTLHLVQIKCCLSPAEFQIRHLQFTRMTEGEKAQSCFLHVSKKHDDPLFDPFLQICNTEDSSKQKLCKSGSK